MTILEQIQQMKAQGIADQDIIATLQEQGISPKAINDALSQDQIKNAIAPQDYEVPQAGQGYSTQEIPQGNYNQQYQDPGYYPQGSYSQQGYDTQNYSSSGTENIIEIAEQVFNEKISKIQEQLDSLNEFKTLAQVKIDTTAERVKKIEATIDKLQAAILQKVGSYGGTLESIKDEMSMMQNSFQKMVKHKVSKKKSKK